MFLPGYANVHPGVHMCADACFTLQVRAAATYALGTLVKVGSDLPPSNLGSDDDLDEATEAAEEVIARCLLKVLCDGSPLVRAELAIGMYLLDKD